MYARALARRVAAYRDNTSRFCVAAYLSSYVSCAWCASIQHPDNVSECSRAPACMHHIITRCQQAACRCMLSFCAHTCIHTMRMHVVGLFCTICSFRICSIPAPKLRAAPTSAHLACFRASAAPVFVTFARPPCMPGRLLAAFCYVSSLRGFILDYIVAVNPCEQLELSSRHLRAGTRRH